MPHPSTPAAVRHPETNLFVALNPAVDYPADDALVEAYPWAFASIETSSEIVEAVARPVVEKATAEPGKRRSRSRTRARS